MKLGTITTMYLPPKTSASPRFLEYIQLLSQKYLGKAKQLRMPMFPHGRMSFMTWGNGRGEYISPTTNRYTLACGYQMDVTTLSMMER